MMSDAENGVSASSPSFPARGFESHLQLTPAHFCGLISFGFLYTLF